MKNEFKNDARSVKTRKAIKYALIQLLKTKELGEISVKELADQAQRNRNSFYTHYRSCHDVLVDISDDVINYVTEALAQFTFEGFFHNPQDILNELTHIILTHQKSASQYLLICYSADMKNRTSNAITDLLFDRYKNETGAVTPSTRYIISFMVSGTLDLYANWFIRGGIDLGDLTTALALFLKNGSVVLRHCLRINEHKNED